MISGVLVLPYGLNVDEAFDIYKSTVILKENILPSEWYERKKILLDSSAAIPGYFTYHNTPYFREIVDCFSPYHPATDVTIMGPLQDGKTFTVIEPIVGYTIEMCPGNILHLTGNSDLSPDASLRIDQMIDNCHIRHLIEPSTNQIKQSRTGDTAIRKEFAGNCVYRVNSITKKNALRLNDIYLLIVDDTDAAKLVDGKVGNLRKTAKGRTAAFEWKAKRLYVSSPESMVGSFIYDSYQLSDKRVYEIPCETCHEMIALDFNIKIDDKNYAGLHWELDNFGRAIKSSVHYVCQLCGSGFTEKNKLKFMNDGKWRPTCEPKEMHHYGYHKNALLKPPGMTSWHTIITDYILCNPPGQPRIEEDFKVWTNTMMAMPYEEPSIQLTATEIMKNCRSYEIGVIPEALSISDGNSDIIWLQWVADCNGNVDDARIDWQLKAYSRAGPAYSVCFGSFGTFIPNQSVEAKARSPRQKWSYERRVENSVWKLVDEFHAKRFKTDTGREMKINFSGIDAGYLDDLVFLYINSSNLKIVGLMGDKETDYIVGSAADRTFKKSTTRGNLYMVTVNMIKDDFAERIKLKWDKRYDKMQPHLYLNYPQYGYENFFIQYEAEEKKEKMVNGKLKYIWEKKSRTHQNHFFDTDIYSIALIDIMLYLLFDKASKKAGHNYGWEHFAALCPRRGPAKQ